MRNLITLVRLWVIGDGKKQGYSFCHPRLGYYFWEEQGSDERAKWEQRFCNWGKQTLDALNTEQLDHKAASVYLLRHYANHLERSHAPAEAFYALVSNGWASSVGVVGCELWWFPE
ncbi:MAG: hypothetical protein HC788_10060 [Sphingopyxis sp.]|nr:hypothetical protein [Sphingopyxis sp.]